MRIIRAFVYLLLVTLAVSCGDKQSSGLAKAENWQPKGLFDPSEIINNPSNNHVLLFETGRVTHFLPDGTSVWMGRYERTNGTWVWHLFANHWRIEPEGDSLRLIELGDPKNPLLRNPTNRFRLTRRAAMPNAAGR